MSDLDTNQSIAKKLKMIRMSEGYTQVYFAWLTEINISTVKKYESGKYEVGLSVVERVLKGAIQEIYTLANDR